MKYAITAKNIKSRHEINFMGAIVDTIKSAYSDAWGLLKKSWKNLLIDITKIEVIGLIFSMIVLLLILIGVIFLVGMPPWDYTVFQDIPLWYYILGFLILIISNLVTGAIGSLVYNIVDNRAKNKKTPFMEQFKKNFVPMVLYNLIVWTFIIVTLLPLLGMLAGGTIALAITCAYPIILLVLYLVISFFVQFALYEIIIERKGVIDGIKASFSIVKKNLLVVFAFNIAYTITVVIIGLPVYGVYFAFDIAGTILEGVLEGSLLGIVISNILSSIGGLILQIVILTAFIPLIYFFWKKIRE